MEGKIYIILAHAVGREGNGGKMRGIRTQDGRGGEGRGGGGGRLEEMHVPPM